MAIFVHAFPAEYWLYCSSILEVQFKKGMAQGDCWGLTGAIGLLQAEDICRERHQHGIERARVAGVKGCACGGRRRRDAQERCSRQGCSLQARVSAAFLVFQLVQCASR